MAPLELEPRHKNPLQQHRKSIRVSVCEKGGSRAICSMSLSDTALAESKLLADSLSDHWNDLVATSISSTNASPALAPLHSSASAKTSAASGSVAGSVSSGSGTPAEEPHVQLMVAADLQFDDGINACLRYLEAVPWSTDEEVEVVNVLARLGMDQTKGGLRVLARLGPTSAEAVYNVLKKLVSQAVARADAVPPADPQSKAMWRASVEKLFTSGSLRAEVRKRVLFEQLDELIDRVQACVVEEAAGGGGVMHFVDMAAESSKELAAKFAVEMDNVAWLMGTMVDRLGFAEYIIKWLSEDQGFVRHVEYFTHRDNRAEAAMYDPLLPIILRLLTLMVGGHAIIPTNTRAALVKLWLPVLTTIPRLPAVFSRERGRLLGEMLGQVILTLPSAQQEEVMDLWLSHCGGRYNAWLDMAAFLEQWLERAARKIRD
ncbi:unnamed protein product [Closterium sp. Naga37s-1]|nr:unnamed protein product [Closterium sp. Naga37s-1]CAI5515068.1 unnamed protein product [Closterium sp. Naga37s-1]